MGGGDSTLPCIPPLTPTDIEGFRVDAWLLEVRSIDREIISVAKRCCSIRIKHSEMKTNEAH